MRKIIAATDFSEISFNTMNYAADMAHATGAKLILLHIYSIPAPVNEVPAAIYIIDQIQDEAKQRLEQLKERLLHRTNDSIIIQTEILPGDVVSAISNFCEKVKPYAVIMGSESMIAVQRFLSGGKTVTALKKIHWPLIIVPKHVQFKKFKKIGLACDFERVEETVHVEEIIDMVREFDAELHVLYVSRDRSKPDLMAESAVLREMLGEINPKFHFLNESDIQDGVSSFAEYKKLDLLIVVPKWHDFPDQIFRTRQSKKLVLHSRIPVLSLHE